jgi:enoyl-CoA hydratase/carnithine racemase
MKLPEFDTINFQKNNALGYLKLNRPDVRNAFNQTMIDELLTLLPVIDKDASIRVLVITGAGKAFQAGADIAELRSMQPMDILRWNEGIIRINARLESMRQPVIAAINGPALGGGLELAISCTFRVMASTAVAGLPEVKLGIIPGTGGTQRLPRLIGKGRASELLLTGDLIDADECYRIGLVNRVVDAKLLMETAEKLAQRIMVNAPIAVEMAKDAMEIGKDLPLEQAVQYSQKNCITCFSTRDMQEGMTAFLEKRKAEFTGK